MECAPCERRNRGRWGENLVDGFMEQQGWNPLMKNILLPGGEIDRVYAERRPVAVRRPLSALPTGMATTPRRFCVAEIKVTTVEGAADLPLVLSEISLRRFVRPHQIRNLTRMGETLLCRDGWLRPAEIYVRLFLAIRMRLKNGQGLPAELLCPARVCMARPEVLLLSFLPELCLEKAAGMQVHCY